MKRSRLILGISGLLIAAAGIGTLSYLAVRHYRDQKEIEALREKARMSTQETQPETRPAATVPTTEPTEPAPVETAPTETETEYKEPYVSPIDFDALWEVNTDIYAWIEIEDTDISYPILQSSTDNSYYLNHTPERKSGFPGSIFTYNVNAMDFTDFNTVIYGHRMDNHQMFSDLKLYRDSEYLNEHRIIHVYLPDRELVYTVFAAVVYDDRLITSYYDNKDPVSCEAYLDSILENRDINSHILTDVPVGTEDRIITLSTCIKGQKEKRYLVVAVLTDEIT